MRKRRFKVLSASFAFSTAEQTILRRAPLSIFFAKSLLNQKLATL
jgi:hypothetical protein